MLSDIWRDRLVIICRGDIQSKQCIGYVRGIEVNEYAGAPFIADGYVFADG